MLQLLKQLMEITVLCLINVVCFCITFFRLIVCFLLNVHDVYKRLKLYLKLLFFRNNSIYNF